MRHIYLVAVFCLLAGCGDTPDEAANAELVRLHNEMQEAQKISNLTEKLEAMERLQQDFEAIPEEYPAANVSIRILSNEEVAGLSNNEFRRAIYDLKRDIYAHFYLTALMPAIYYKANGLTKESAGKAASELDLSIRERFATCLIEHSYVENERIVSTSLPWVESVMEQGLQDMFLDLQAFDWNKFEQEYPQITSQIRQAKGSESDLKAYVEPGRIDSSCADILRK